MLGKAFLVAKVAPLLELGIRDIEGLGHAVDVALGEVDHGRDVNEEDEGALLHEVDFFGSVALAVKRLSCLHNHRIQLVHDLDHEGGILITKERDILNKLLQLKSVDLVLHGRRQLSY